MKARFVQANLIARDWRTLVAFYRSVFGCTPIPPERDLSGLWLEAASTDPAARFSGVHLRLPGGGDNWPTSGILQYSLKGPEAEVAIHQPGSGHRAQSGVGPSQVADALADDW